ncbi:sirohydrochlorin chelatase [Candidatus Nitrosocosmicus franklandus]|uniref:Sirohydrochlorin cobaltochelatase n=1 Tax=Candidatus Nitrosocosmicus franklandianus TaxID=1798806 RepID=A0A484IDY8_9ARCH|nr:CbiX/SirB N-terminal domain-containing protein [Candidatus Nitrosocosmicus franklandus]VFJ15026.1 Sirohydrochlorin cobaltochelatase [Candidatus Nitrosocosmicus franklandus]
MTRKALLIIDRGSKMKEVRDELQETCNLIKDKAGYDYVDYCFLEVIPPFIDEGIKKCVNHGVDSVTIVPYFLYPGMKLKDAVKRCASLIHSEKKKMVITKPLSYQPMVSEIVLDRIRSVISQKELDVNKKICLLLIGHGSSDKRAREAFLFTVQHLKTVYEHVKFCFLELEPPNIEEGFKECLESKPDVIIVVPYFLHKGIHIQKDILVDLENAENKFGFRDVFVTPHIGVDNSAINLIISLAKEAEKKSGLF